MLIILVAAAFIIYGRIGAIMDYPKVFAEKTEESQQIESATEEETVLSSASSEGQAAQSSTGDDGSSSESGSTKSDSGYISIVKGFGHVFVCCQEALQSRRRRFREGFRKIHKEKRKSKINKIGKFQDPYKSVR